jgi:hypothetical protein
MKTALAVAASHRSSADKQPIARPVAPLFADVGVEQLVVGEIHLVRTAIEPDEAPDRAAVFGRVQFTAFLGKRRGSAASRFHPGNAIGPTFRV